jgi:hypothetical protein
MTDKTPPNPAAPDSAPALPPEKAEKDTPARTRIGTATVAGAAIGSAALLAAALYAGSRRGRGRKRATDTDADETPPATGVAPHFDAPETD